MRLIYVMARLLTVYRNHFIRMLQGDHLNQFMASLK